MLIQNIENKSRVYYLLGNPFLNTLISYEFDFAKDDELVDYYVNFLKSLSIKLNSETVNFFFNDKLKHFPLLFNAIKFFNHKDQLVRTSVQSITLTLLNIPNPEMQTLFTVLPFCQYYANLSCRLRGIWTQIDTTIEQISELEATTAINQGYEKTTSFAKPAAVSIESKMETLSRLTEDSNEILFYVQDIVTSCTASNKRAVDMLINALLNYSYLPVLVRSLVALKFKPFLSLTTCLYLLS